MIFQDKLKKKLKKQQQRVMAIVIVSSLITVVQSMRVAGKEASLMVKEVNELINEGELEVLIKRKPQDLVSERVVEMTVGMESKLDEIWRWVQDPSVEVIGVYGMGGVGKTTLFRRLNNKFLNAKHDFNLIIWIVVSKELVKLEKIQQVICNKLEIPDHIWRNVDEEDRAAEIMKGLRSKKFVIFLDDFWENFDLLKVGIPLGSSQNGSKILFMTRSEEVCRKMKADRRIKVEPLSPKDALCLFQENVGKEVFNSHSDIPELAQVIVRECRGLPLALITVGRAMSCRKNPKEWEHAAKVLQTKPSKFSVMENEVFMF